MESILKKGELAIIMPVLNCVKYTYQMIPTIQTKHPYKLILINNGSTDETRAYFDVLSEVDNIKVFNRDDNIGVGPAWNFGIYYAIDKFNSRYFFIPNNDILLHPNAIDILVECIKKPKVALCSATDVCGKVNSPHEVKKMDIPETEELKEEPEFSCFMLKRETIDKVGLFDENFYPAYFEDNDYHYRINLAGYKGVKTNRALYFHYGSRTIKDSEEVKIRSNTGYAANRNYYIKKWGGKPGEETYMIPFAGKK